MIIIALLFAFALPLITFAIAWFITKKERQTLEQQQTSLPIQFVKAAKSFKIAAIISVSMPFLLLFPFLFSEPTHSTADDFLIFLILLSIAIIISSLCCINSYNYLFYTPSSTKAFYILSTPFLPFFIIGAFLTFIASLFGGNIIGPGLIIMGPHAIILAVMASILKIKRRKGGLV